MATIVRFAGHPTESPGRLDTVETGPRHRFTRVHGTRTGLGPDVLYWWQNASWQHRLDEESSATLKPGGALFSSTPLPAPQLPR